MQTGNRAAGTGTDRIVDVCDPMQHTHLFQAMLYALEAHRNLTADCGIHESARCLKSGQIIKDIVFAGKQNLIFSHNGLPGCSVYTEDLFSVTERPLLRCAAIGKITDLRCSGGGIIRSLTIIQIQNKAVFRSLLQKYGTLRIDIVLVIQMLIQMVW